MGTSNPYFQAPILIPVIEERGVKCFELGADWRVNLDDGRWLVVPKGSRSNFASVPPFLRWAISSSDPVIVLPAIVHDYLVSELQNIKPNVYSEVPGNGGHQFVISESLYPGNGFDWVASAKIFRKLALSFRGRSAQFKARLCYVAIRLFGIVREQPHV